MYALALIAYEMKMETKATWHDLLGIYSELL